MSRTLREPIPLETIRAVRAALIQDKSLSIYAKNVQILSEGDRIVLRGRVRSENERQRVQNIAARVAGMARVRNDLDVDVVKAR